MIYFLIPSYNDSDNFSLLLSNIKKNLSTNNFKVFIVDDGSTDTTKSIISKLEKRFPVRYLGYQQNRGPGYAFKFGFNYLIPKLKKQDLVITMEADNTADFSILKKMIENSKKNDVVLASPYAKGGKLVYVPWLRRILSIIANYLDSLIFRVPNVRTYSSFYRVYKSSVIKKLKKIYKDKFITEFGFPVFVEMLIKLNKIGAKVTEVSSTVSWENKKGKSKIKILKSIRAHLLLYLNYFQGKYDLN